MPLGKNIFNKVNSYFQHFYKTLERPFSFSRNKSQIYLYPELRKMNKIMKKFYKHDELQITATDNLIPFKFKTPDNVTIDAVQYITDINSDKWIISSHWFAGDKYWSLYWAKPFITLGYNVLVYDFRNHGVSQKGLPVTMGATETNDLLGAMNWLKENKKYNILGLMGVSMGAFVTNNVIAKYHDLMEDYKVKFAISDVTYGSIKSLLLHVRNIRFKGVLRKSKSKKVINKIIKTQSKATNIDWEKEIDIFRLYEKLDVPVTVPTFFSHGLNDKVTPPTDTFRLFIDRSKKTDLDEIEIYNWSSHAMSLKTHHIKQIFNWIKFENKIIKDNESTKKALDFYGINEERILNNPEEKNEIYSFYFDSNFYSSKNNN